MTDATTRLRELLAASNPPWLLTNKFDGSNWLVCSLGNAGSDDWHITTDGVHASELVADAESDGRLIVAAVNALPALLDVVEAAREVLNECTPSLESNCSTDIYESFVSALAKLNEAQP